MEPWLAARGCEPAPPSSAGRESRAATSAGPAGRGPTAGAGAGAGAGRRLPQAAGRHSKLQTDGRGTAPPEEGRWRVTSGACQWARPAPGSGPGGPFRIPLARGPSVHLFIPSAWPRQVRAGPPESQEASPGRGRGCVLRAQGPLPEPQFPVPLHTRTQRRLRGTGCRPGPRCPHPGPLGRLASVAAVSLRNLRCRSFLLPGVWEGAPKGPRLW